jgi:hypothetical protein
MAMLAQIYDLQRDAIKAEACRSFIPLNLILEEDPLMYLFTASFPIGLDVLYY